MLLKDLVHNLKNNINGPLPGMQCQKLMAPSDRGENVNFPHCDLPKRNAAILILLYEKNNTTYTVFIKRPIYDGAHGGQIAFPGGKVEDHDITIYDTALRETREEIGINTDSVEVIGSLTPLYIPVSNIEVTPVIAYSNVIPTFQIDKTEVDYTVEALISEIVNIENKKEKNIFYKERKITAPYFDIKEEFIWGATAMILNEFICLLNQPGIHNQKIPN